MYLIRINGVAVEISNNFDRIYFSFDFNFVRLHSLLNPTSNLSEPGIDTSLSQSSIGGVLDSLKQLVVGGIECNSEGTINDSSLDMSSEIDFADIIVVQDSIISRIGSVMCCYVIKRTPSGEGYSRFKPFFRS
jgi:hypothetical protein